MKSRLVFLLLILILPAALVSFPSIACAQEPEPATAEPAGEELDFGQMVTAENLEAQSGGEAASIDKVLVLLGDVQMGADVDGNSLISNSTGSNYLNGNAFTDSVGMHTVFQVTGNMNVLQSSYIINVSIGD